MRNLELFPVPDVGFRWTLIGLAAINAVISLFLEDFVIEVVLQRFWKKFGFKSTAKYSLVESWMRSNSDWPPLSAGPRIQKEKPVSPSSKSFPFTVEVIGEDSQTLEKSFDFIKPGSARIDDDEVS